MYLIIRDKGGHRAIPIRSGDKWDLYKVVSGRKDIRIVLRVKGRRYLIHSTYDLARKYHQLGLAQLTPLCDEIIAILTDSIKRQQEFIDFPRIVGMVQYRHHRRWCDKGLISPVSLEEYFGHPVDPKMEELISYVRAAHRDIIVMDCEPPINHS